MQTIGELIKQKQTNTPCNSSLPIKKEQQNLAQLEKDLSSLNFKFGPDNLAYVLSNAEKAYLAESPSLGEVMRKYGERNGALWIHMHVLALYGSSSNKDKGIADGIPFFSNIFASKVKRFKLTELMLFFARYKAGMYDNSYSTFDARRIGAAFFQEFLPERDWELDRIIRAEEQRKIEERIFTPPEGYTSFTWNEEIKRRAKEGDPEAKKILYGKG